MGYFSYFSEPSLAFVGPLVSIGQARLDRTLVPRPRGGRESGMVSRDYSEIHRLYFFPKT